MPPSHDGTFETFEESEPWGIRTDHDLPVDWENMEKEPDRPVLNPPSPFLSIPGFSGGGASTFFIPPCHLTAPCAVHTNPPFLRFSRPLRLTRHPGPTAKPQKAMYRWKSCTQSISICGRIAGDGAGDRTVSEPPVRCTNGRVVV